MTRIDSKGLNTGLRIGLALVFAMSAFGAVPGEAVRAQSDGIPANFLWVEDDTTVYGNAAPEYEGEYITLTLDDPATPESPDYQETGSITDGEINFNYGFTLFGRSGVTATFTSILGYRSYTLPVVSTTNVSYLTDQVSGTAAPGAAVHVGTLDNVDGATIALRTVIAEADGTWLADFSLPGSNPGEETTADILPFQMVDARVDLPAGGDEQSSLNNAPDPRIVALPERNMVRSRQYPVGAQVTLSIEDPANPGEPIVLPPLDVTGDPLDPWSGWANFELDGITTLAPGQRLTMTDGTITKVFDVPLLLLDRADSGGDIVSGRAEPGKRVYVRVFDETGEIYKTQLRPWADENGVWIADFSGWYDLLSTDYLQIYIQDDDRDKTQIETYPSDSSVDPTLVIRYDINVVRIWDAELDVPIQVQVYDPEGALVFEQTRMPWIAEPDVSEQTLTDFYLGSAVELATGMRVVFDNGLHHGEHVVRHVMIEGMDPDLDQVWGQSVPGTPLTITIDCGADVCGARDVVAEPDGSWSVDFAIAAGPNPEQAAYDLLPTTILTADYYGPGDESGWTRFFYGRPDSGMRRHQIYAYSDRVDALGWTPGNTLTLSIDDPANGPGVDYTDTAVVVDRVTRRPRARFNLDGFTITPGMTVTVADEYVTKSLETVALGGTSLNAGAETVSGFGPPNTILLIEGPCDDDHPCTYRRVSTDAAGFWQADFANPGPIYDEAAVDDLDPGDSIYISAFESDGDLWTVEFSTVQPRVNTSLTQNLVSSSTWPAGRTVTITVDDPETPAVPDMQVVQQLAMEGGNSRLNFNFNDVFDLRPGMLLNVSDGELEVAYTLAEIRVDAIDLEHDTISGTAAPGAEVWVDLWSQESWRSTAADEYGHWMVDFSAPDPFDPAAPITDLTPSDHGSATTWSGRGNTLVVWQPDWAPDAPEALVLPLEVLPDLAAPALSLSDFMVQVQLREPLFFPNRYGDIRPGSAASLDVSSDGLTYTVHLRPDARWSDGAPLTAAHVRDGYLYELDPQTTSGYAVVLFDIAGAQAFNEGADPDPSHVGITVLNDQTLQFTLQAPAVHFNQVLAGPYAPPVRLDLMALYGDDWALPGNYPASGPYSLFAADGARIELRPNPYYHSPEQVAFPAVIFRMIPTQEQILQAYRDDRLDAIPDARWQLYSIQSDPALQAEYQSVPYAGIFSIVLNSRRAPTDNPVVRQALAAATNRALVFSGAYGPQPIATGVIPPEMFGHQGGAVGFPFNPDQARALLATVYPDPAQMPEVSLVANTHQFKYVEEVASAWRTELGIRVRTTYYRNVSQFRQSCAGALETCDMNGVLISWYSDFVDAFDILGSVYDPHGMIMTTSSGWENARYDELLGLLRGETDPALRLSYINEAERILVQDEAAVIPLFFPYTSALAKPGLFLELDPAINSFTRWSWSDIDQDGLGDLSDPCPNDPSNVCDPAASGAGVIGADGGEVAGQDGGAAISVPAGALENSTPLAITAAGGGFVLDTDLGEAQAALSWRIGPDGTQFEQPAAVTLRWPDADDDGLVDEIGVDEGDLIVFKDGLAISQTCSLDSGCDPAGNTFTVQVASLSHFVLGVLQAPVIEAIHAPLDPVRVGASLTVSAQVSGLSGDYTAVWNWGDGTQTEVASLSAEHVYAQAGVYEIRLTILRDGGSPVSAIYQYVVIYNPDGGFITGGGWILSPAGAFQPDPTKTGKANFGFVAKYKKGSAVPDGNLEFHLKEAGLKFQSSSLEWLVVGSTGDWAILKGRGILDGSGEIYTFTLWISDSRPDTFALRLTWEDALGLHILYDSSPKAPIGGGSLVVHQSK